MALSDFYQSKQRELAVYKKVPRPAYREIQRGNSIDGGFLLDGLELKKRDYGEFNVEAYYNKETRSYSGIALLTFYSGKRLEVSINGLGENSAKQKIMRALTFDLDRERMQKHKYMPSQKRAEHKARAKSRNKSTSSRNF